MSPRVSRARMLVLMAALLAGCADAALPVIELTPATSPAGEESGQPFLAAMPDGRVLLSWLEQQQDGAHALRFAAGDGAVWSEPKLLAVSSRFFVNWADFPSITVLPDGRLAVHWLERSGPGTYAYDVRISMSSDGGRTWAAPITPHRDGTRTEHGFATLFPDGAELGAVWLDGRNMGGGDLHGDGGDMTLRFARIGATGEISAEAELDARTCECCQTDVAVTEQGPVIVFRDRSPSEIRDIAIVRRPVDGWSAPVPVHGDGWRIDGCPVNGPAIAAQGNRVVVAWFTAADETPRVNVAFSRDAGATFGSPVRVDEGNPGGRVDLVLRPDGVALVSWLERVEGRARVQVRAIRDGSEPGPVAVVDTVSAERRSGFPRMAFAGDVLVFAWTDPGRPSRVRVATAHLRTP